MKLAGLASVLLCLLLISGGAGGSDHDETVPYLRTGGFNVPVLAGWENQSTDEIAQFHLAEHSATIRTAIVALDDPLAASQAELANWIDAGSVSPVYSGKVNLADGTWHVAIFEPDADISVSIMARRVGERTVVISFIERDESNRILMLTMAQEDESQRRAHTELVAATDLLMSPLAGEHGRVSEIKLSSGAWALYPGAGHTRMGMVFGNDSFLALAKGPIGVKLATLADAYFTVLLGFFITPDNSGYLALGLAAAFVTLGLLVFSYFWRARSLDQDAALIRHLARADD
ncbi:MAG: hypothetical protein F4X02_12410 [Chloroflexi bacterium]|nr:hypothetical protein [Chloroflexota bacterium]